MPAKLKNRTQIVTYVDPVDLKEIKRRAGELSVTVSQYVRGLIANDLGKKMSITAWQRIQLPKRA